MLSQLDIANRYMEILFSGIDYHRLHSIFADDFEFVGPKFGFSTAKDYIDILEKYPPVDCSYDMTRTFEEPDFITLIYSYKKNEEVTRRWEYFTFSDDKISKIELVTDSGKVK
jgi:hypothetical protein